MCPFLFCNHLDDEERDGCYDLQIFVFLVSSNCSDSFTNLGLWALGLADSHINESNCKLMSPEHYFS